MSFKIGPVVLILLVVCTLHAPREAEAGGFGLGIMAGEPTGLNAKIWTGYNTAFVMGAAWSFGAGEDALHLHGDFILHNFDILDPEEGRLPLYYGVGGRIKLLDEDELIGARIPLGIAYIFADEALDLFFEAVPVMDLAPETDFRFNGAVGVRYYFK